METERLIIRTFEPPDLPHIHRILVQTFGRGTQGEEAQALREREAWLRCSIPSQEWLPKLNQPPYGDRAIVLRSTGVLIGAAGYVPLLAPFEQIPELRRGETAGGHYTPEVGLFWVIDPAHQRRGYAAEAARMLIEHAFKELRLERILAMTEHDNAASQAVMHKLGMRITCNSRPEPQWMQVVGVLENPG